MYRIIAAIFLYFFIVSNSAAAVWVKVNENSASKLMVDRQSILQQNQLTRAWIKIEYKTPQKNIEFPDKEYDLSKLLWYFDCPVQKSATSQVFQYMNSHLVHSAGIDIKDAEFIEPVPETDLDLAMRFICATNKPAKPTTEPKSAIEKKPPTAPAAAVGKAEEPVKPAEPNPNATANATPATTKLVASPNNEKSVSANVDKDKKTLTKESRTKDSSDANWSYKGKDGPDNWGKLKPEFATCDIGRNQSPINIEATIKASLKPLKGIQKFTVKEIINNGRTVQANFKEGNMLLVDDVSFKMKQVHFHAPSEHTIQGKSFPLEAHFVHVDSKGNVTKVGVLFKEGKANAGLEKLWAQIPSDTADPIPLKTKVSATEIFPDKRDYYRFSGSLTAPPCTEGVRWILMKTPMTISKEQIEVFEKAIRQPNNRPVQPLNGRMVIE